MDLVVTMLCKQTFKREDQIHIADRTGHYHPYHGTFGIELSTTVWTFDLHTLHALMRVHFTLITFINRDALAVFLSWIIDRLRNSRALRNDKDSIESLARVWI
jgi:hypothetical protein